MISKSDLSAGALWVIDRLEARGYEAYIVGGSVRDMLMGIAPHDFDITTNATPDEVTAAFDGERIIETGLKHGTVTVLYENEPIEITTYRIEGAYTDNRHPSTVSFTKSIEEDLSRRDFTVNAIGYNPKSGLVDIYGGCEDIQNRIIRCVGVPEERFREDGLRILRALRFASVLGFDIEKATEEAIHGEKELLQNISRERVFSELTKLLCGKNVCGILLRFGDVMKEIIDTYRDLDFSFMSSLENDRITRYAAMLSAFCDGDAAASALRTLKADRKLILSVRELIANIHSDLDAKHLLGALGKEQTYRLLDIRRARGLKSAADKCEVDRIIADGECFCLEMLNITGSDLINLGFPCGSGIGKALDILLHGVMECGLENTYDALEKQALIIKNNI